MEQSPSRQLLDACSIAMKALVKEPLLKHSDNDVKVYLASCLCEVFRITAPELPYEDNEMKAWDFENQEFFVLGYVFVCSILTFLYIIYAGDISISCVIV